MQKLSSGVCHSFKFGGLLAVATVLLTTAISVTSARAGDIQVGNATGHLIGGAENGYRVEIYMDIENAGHADRLYAVRTALSDKAMLSVVNKDKTKHEGHHDGMNMPETKHAHTMALEVPAGGAVSLAMGESHIMVMNPDELPSAGATFPVTLFFEQAGKVTVEVTMQTVDLALQPLE